ENSCDPHWGTDGLFVTSIDYTGHVPTNSSGGGGTPPFAHVKFDYDPRRETRRARFGSTTLPRNKRLRSISTIVDVNGTPELTGIYALTYAPDYVPHTNYNAVTNDPMLPTRLTRIGYCSVDQPVPPPPAVPLQHCMKPLDFGWDGGGYQWNETTAYAPPEPIGRTGDNTSYGSQFVDLDGDGRLDLVRSHGGNSLIDSETPYTHAWRNSGQGWEPKDEWALPIALAHDDGTSTGATFADVNGDGLPDIVHRHMIACPSPRQAQRCDLKLEVFINQIRKDPSHPWALVSGYSTVPGSWGGGGFDFLAREHVLDMNGDGRADIVHVGSDDTDDIQVRYANQAGTGWDIPVENYDSTLLATGSVFNSGIRFEDINRDGLPDAVAGNPDSFCYVGSYAINTGKNHDETVNFQGHVNTFLGRVWNTRFPTWCPINDTSPPVPADKRLIGDIDGDGLRDTMSSFMLRTLTQTQGTGFCSDVGCLCDSGCTGDSSSCGPPGQTQCDCTCPIGLQVTDPPRLRFATGLGWTLPTADPFVASLMPYQPHPNENPIPTSAKPDFIFSMADLNADGLADFILNHPDGGQVFINNGNGFDALEGVPSWVNTAGPAPLRRVPVVPTENKDFSPNGASFIDLNGDGVTDLIQGTQSTRRAWINAFKPPVITQFPNGLATATVVQYLPITSAQAADPNINVYSDGSPEPVVNTTFFMTPLRVAWSVLTEDGTASGQQYETNYQYSGMRGSTAGRGPQGFSHVRVIDGRQHSTSPVTRRVTDTIYNQVYPYTGMPRVVAQWLDVGGLPPLGNGNLYLLNATVTAYCAKLPDGTDACDTDGHYDPRTSLFTYPQTIGDTSYFYDGDAVTQHTSTTQLGKTTSYVYDTFGNPTKTTVRTEIVANNCVRGTGPDATCQFHQQTVENNYDLVDFVSSDQLKKLGKVKRSVVTVESNVTTDPDGITHTTEYDYGYSPDSYPPGDSVNHAVRLRQKRLEPGAGVPIEEHTAYDHDAFGNLTVTRECGTDFGLCFIGPSPAQRITTVSYKVSDFNPGPNARVTTLPYGDGRFPVMTTNALNQREYSAFDPLHAGLVQKTEPNGIHTCKTYDAFGRQTSQTDRCGTGMYESTTTTERFVTDSSDVQWAKVVTRTRPATGATTWAFGDSLGRETFVRARTFGGGFAESDLGYDQFGRKVLESAPRNANSGDPTYYTQTSFDDIGRVRTVTRDIGVIDASGQSKHSIQSLSYQGMAVITQHNVDGEDAAHLLQQRRLEMKNILGKVGYVEDVNNTRISFLYDADGNLTDTVEGTNTTHTDYEPKRGRRRSVADPDLGTWQYTYTEFGQLATQTDAAGRTFSITYDKLGRVTNKRDVQTGAESQWAYDTAPGAGIGKVAAMVSAPDDRFRGPCFANYGLPSGEKRAVRSFSYTSLGEVAQTDDCVDGDVFTTSHAYDQIGREAITTYPAIGSENPLTVHYSYTSLGFLYYLNNAADGSLYWAATGRDASGRVTSEYTRNGVETTSIRNQSTGWLMASHSTAHADGDTQIQNWGYQFDEIGNLRRRIRADGVNGSPSDETFTYDSLNRLHTSTTHVGPDTYNDQFDYDVRGNIRAKGGKGYTYGTEAGCVAGPHAVCTVDNGPQYQYDSNGNVTSDGNRYISYDLANKVTHIQNGGNSAEFIYGADNSRVVQEAANSGHTSRTVYVGLGATGKSVYERTMREDGAVEHTEFLYAPGEHYGNAFAIRVVRGGTTGQAST
ncbi:MAG TPA: FG-GAP-like repeat-containing protein, partial [Polyangia bacterium]|nr:FG-GAP-like repeat-containing protein [Polyangia bacterium]